MQLHIITWTEKEEGKRAVERCYKLTSDPYDKQQMARINSRAHNGFKVEPVNEDTVTALTHLAEDGEYWIATGKSTFNASVAIALNLKKEANTSKVTASNEQRLEFAEALGLETTGIMAEIKRQVISDRMTTVGNMIEHHMAQLNEYQNEMDLLLAGIAELEVEQEA